jgi:hypothetical protein
MTAEFESLGSASGAVAATLLLLAAALGAGWLVVPGAKAGSRRVVEVWLIRAAVGLDLVGWLGVILGSLRLLGGRAPLILLAGLAGLNVVPLWRRWLDRRAQVAGRGAASSAGRLPRWARLAIGVVGLITLGPALCFPTGWDELVYHHELPRRWQADGWPAVYFDLPYSGFPSLGEIVFWLATPLGGAIVPRLVSWLCWAGSLVLVYRLLVRRLAVRSAAALVAAFALSSAVLLVSANCYVESLLMLNFAAALVALADRRLLSSPWRRAMVLGILAGGAAAAKLTGLAVSVAIGAWYAGQLWWPPRTTEQGEEPRMARRTRIGGMLVDPCPSVLIRGCLISCVFLMFTAPFYLRPGVLTGDPFYPYFAWWFSGDPARVEMSRYHHELGARFGLHEAAAIVQAPVFLAFGEEVFDGSFGWQFLLVLVLAAMALRFIGNPRRRGLVIGPLGASIGLYLFWLATAQQARFAIPAVMTLLPLAAIGLRRVHGNSRTAVVALLMAASLFSAPWRTAGYYFGSCLAAAGLIHQSQYVNEMTDKVYLPLVKAIGERTPEDARLLLLFEHRSYYLPRRCLIGTPFFQERGFTPPEAFAEPAAIMKLLDRERITHVVVSKTPAGPDVLADWIDRTDPFIAALARCVSGGQLVPSWESERYVVFEVKSED